MQRHRGLLGSFPGLATQIEVHRLPFEKPRLELLVLLGEQHQSLPVLIFDDTKPVPDDALISSGKRYIDSPRRILSYLADRYGFPHIH